MLACGFCITANHSKNQTLGNNHVNTALLTTVLFLEIKFQTEKISALPIAKNLGLTSVIPVVCEGETSRATVKNIVALATVAVTRLTPTTHLKTVTTAGLYIAPGR